MCDKMCGRIVKRHSSVSIFIFIGLFQISTSLEIKCGHPAVPPNSKVSLSKEDLSPGTLATYTCDPGYELFGSFATTCSNDGTWQGELPFCGTNVAFRKPANQSTTVRGGNAGNANDGQKSTVHDGKQCTETLKEASPWWQVDLLRPYPVRVVRVTTRGCCGHQPLKDIEIRVGNSSFDLQKNPLCAWFPGTIDVPEFGGPIKNVTITVGREATLECIVDNLSTYKVAWLRVDTQTILTIAVHVITKNHRIAVANSDKKTWFLHIREVKESDRGWYMCQINTDPMKSQVGYLEVVVPPDILDYPTSTDMVVREGNNVTLQCVATGFPPPTIVWKREQGEPILLGNGEEVLSVEGSVFTITRVNRLHMGAYLCIASNRVPPSVSKRIMLIVHFPPMIWIQNQLVGAQEGQSMTLQCHSEAFPKSINYWTRNGDTIAQGFGGKYEPVLIDNAYKVQMKLTIKSVMASDYGSYKCISRNSLGETDGEIKLYHIPKPTTSAKPSTTTEAIILTPPPSPPTQPEKEKKPGKTKQKQREKGKERRPVKGVDEINEVVSETDRPPKEKGIQLRSEKGGRLQADSKLSRSVGRPSNIPNSACLCVAAILKMSLNP